MIRRVFLAFALILLSGAAASAEAPRSLAWTDLLPGDEAPVDPLAGLTMNQRIEMRLIAAARKRQELGFVKDDDRGKLAERNLTRKLKDEGLNVEGLLARFAVFQDAVMVRNRTANAGLDKRTVRLPGHVLPLTVSDAGVTEFLLVPYVGACIHVPPPPPNQIVVVRTKEPFEAVGVFATVWVTGRLSVEAATRKLSLVDGTAAVPSTYAMDAARVERRDD